VPQEPQRVPKADLQEMFNREVQPRLDNGQYRRSEVKRRPPRRDIRDQFPSGSASVIFDIHEVATGKFVAQAHAYIAPNGSLLASGRLDPKILVSGGITYHPTKE